MFSKSPSLRELIFSVWTPPDALEASLTEEDELDIARELLHRVSKKEGFSDTIEGFWRENDTAASTESL